MLSGGQRHILWYVLWQNRSVIDANLPAMDVIESNDFGVVLMYLGGAVELYGASGMDLWSLYYGS